MAERGSVTYPLPLDGGFIAELRLPEDLTMAEAERIATYVKVLAVEEVTTT